MHELGIVFHVIRSVEEIGEKNGLSAVSSVTMELGEVSSVIDRYLQDCWRWAADRSELLRGAELKIETLPALSLCEDCSKTYETVQYGRTCPFCKSEKTRLLCGNEINIKEIEAC